MNGVLQGLNFRICLAYLDDIILYSVDIASHLERLEQLFQRIREAGLKFKYSKCHLMCQSIPFLGFIVGRDGISTDPEKVKTVEEWRAPSNVHEVRSFLGLASYYRKFVEDFAKLASPLHKLTAAHAKFIWDQDCQTAFETLKHNLVTAPILAMPTETDTFTLDTDASNYAMGAVLSQYIQDQEKVIAYASRTFSKTEINYCTTRKELLAIVHFISYFRQYLLGRHFRVRTDHAALLWLRRMPDPVGQEARWLEKLEEYDFTVEHRAGSKHTNADFCSRPQCRKACCHDEKSTASVELISRRNTVETGDNTSWSTDDIIAAQMADPVLMPIYTALALGASQPTREEIAAESGETKAYWFQWPVLALRSGLLCPVLTVFRRDISSTLAVDFSR